MEESLILSSFGEKGKDIRSYSPLALAFLGDAVYSLVIRSLMLAQGNRPPEKLHQDTRRYVCAQAQARIGRSLQTLLSEEERDVYRRGRNADPKHRAKSATEEEYLEATALEALCGWLFLEGREPRLLELLREGMRRAEESGETRA